MLEPETLNAADLQTLPPVDNGLQQLMQDIASRRKIFCLCATARDYHVGVADTLAILERNSDAYREVAEDETRQRIFVPVEPQVSPGDIDHAVVEAKADVERAYGILSRAYKDYDRRTRLLNQKAIHDRFTMAFRRLREYGILPGTTQNALFNHQGMTLLMETCFRTDRDLVRYLQDPDCLVD
jgi:hypothetical protein